MFNEKLLVVYYMIKNTRHLNNLLASTSTSCTENNVHVYTETKDFVLIT